MGENYSGPKFILWVRYLLFCFVFVFVFVFYFCFSTWLSLGLSRLTWRRGPKFRPRTRFDFFFFFEKCWRPTLLHNFVPQLGPASWVSIWAKNNDHADSRMTPQERWLNLIWMPTQEHSWHGDLWLVRVSKSVEGNCMWST